jgi:sterol desaturase/sphingolipid hydroxylase (fatty acid hydroxylase superfamily)
MTTFYLLILATLSFDFVLLALLVWGFHSPRLRQRRIATVHVPMKVPRRAQLQNMALIGTLSLGATVGLIYGLAPWLLSLSSVPAWHVAAEALAVLLVYDFAYYFMHRAMHHKKLMRWVHGVHHRARSPTALESLYQHPVELLSGLLLLMASTWAVGPVHPYAFAAAFFVYSTFNILVHSGLEFPGAVFAPLNTLMRKHHTHHQRFDKNYASLTPLPDLFFRTAG